MALACQAEEEEGREGSHDLEQTTGAETGAGTHSQVDGLVRAGSPSPDSGKQVKKSVECKLRVECDPLDYHKQS